MACRTARILTLTLAALLPAGAMTARGQEDYRFEIGAGIGMTGYLGDANSSNLWRNPGVDGEAIFRYILNPRIAFKTNAYLGTLRGNTAQMTNVMPDGRDFKFSTTFYELGEMAEFNFFAFGVGESYRKLVKFTPYIAAGLSVTGWSVGGHSSAAFTIPLGVGVKYKLGERLNLGLEFLMKKAFTDKLDGPDLADPYGIKSSFMSNTDWYSATTVSLTYEFSRRCATCHYKD